MTDDRLHTLDQVAPPNQWAEITQRAAAGPSVALAEIRPDRPRRLLLAAAIVLVVACVAGALVLARHGDGRSPAAEGLDRPEEIVGRTWYLNRLVVDGREVGLPGAGPGGHVTLVITGTGEVRFSGCNTLTSSGRVTGDRLQLSGDGNQTLQGCGETALTMDQLMGALVGSGPTIELRGHHLALRSANGEAEFTDVGPDADLADPASVWGRTWTLTRLRQDRDDVEIPASGPGDAASPVGELDLSRTGVVAFHGCNAGGLRAHIDGHQLVADEGWGSEQRRCVEQLMRLDDVIAELMQSGPAIELQGPNLAIRSSTIVAEFVESSALEMDITEPEDPTAIWGVAWDLISLRQGVLPVELPPSGTGTDGTRPAGSPFFLDLTDRGTVVFTGCNGTGGPAALDGIRLVLSGSLDSTAALCADPLMRLDAVMVELLANEPTVQVGGGQLVLRADGLVAQFEDPAR